MSSLIAAYLADLDRALAFDPALARDVRDEIEDHLREAAEQRGEHEAVARFGQAPQIARAYASAGLATRLRGSWLAALGLLCITFVLMRLRTLLLDVPGGAGALTWLDRGGLTVGLLCIVAVGVLAYRTRFAAIDRRIQLVLRFGCSALILSVGASLLRALPVVDGTAALALLLLSATAELALIALLLERLFRLGRYTACLTM